ncbi:MAG: hypothetical protein J6A01_11395, partial [Proteobacteria bacterium]|nr:hypothetical protein [Pseudomonadota bacterium]
MKKNLACACLMVAGALLLVSCDDGTNEDKKPQDKVVCQPGCARGETCDNGVCKCGEKVCEADEICQSGVCQKATGDCPDGNCEQPADACENACKGDETCVDGTCKCGENICSSDEICQSDVCKKTEPECEGEECEHSEDDCNGACSGEETCAEGVCKCGDSICSEQEVCHAGTCETVTEIPPGEGEEDDKCETACGEGMVCVGGKCEPVTSVIECNPECKDGQVCDNSGTCIDIIEESCYNCVAGETCVSGVCMCGKTTCNENEICDNNVCVLIDPCADKTCPSGQACSGGECKALDVWFNKASLDVLLSSTSDKLIATRTGTKALTWTIDGVAASNKAKGILCVTPKKTYSQVLKDCIVVAEDKKTETVQFVGLSRKPKTMVVKVTDDSGHSAETSLKLKPYFGMESFVKLDSSLFVYRNTVTPGGFMKEEKYTDSTETEEERVANLGGEGNPYGLTSFDEEATAIFDADMYTKFIRPKMIRYKDTYYATRASVVAAARFLVLQFPYDIPYSQGGAYDVVTGRGHYIWAFWAKDGNLDADKTNSSDVAVFGLNLTPNAYNSSLTHVSQRDTNKPWGTYNDNIKDFDLTKYPGRNNKYKFTGLECSGFVTWALRNGRMGLGDWLTTIFSRDGSCIIDGKKVRNYRCKTHVNHMMSQIPKNDSGNAWGQSSSNSYNVLNSAYEKLNLLQDSDFKQLDGKDEATVQAILDDAKAGDLLWLGKYINEQEGTYANGHIAMVIGLKRDKNGKVTEIDVGEAAAESGNKLNRWTVSKFVTNSAWVAKAKGKNASFLIKMDHVYNYFTDKYKITDEGKKSDCKDGVKSGGNCYL